jgi:hypothetical protein
MARVVRAAADRFPMKPPIYFYISGDQAARINAIPSLRTASAEDRQMLFGTATTTHHNWCSQTSIYLREAGFDCRVVNEFPEDGIVFASVSDVGYTRRPGQKALLVCILADGNASHFYAPCHVVQNREQLRWIRAAYFIPHWPQSLLIPRDRGRGSRCENVFFFGDEPNLAAELRGDSFRREVDVLGMNLRLIPPTRWHDYSEADAVLAVRGFDDNLCHNKPATKLVNAWRAGVPAVLGRESAYLAERAGPLDYLEVRSREDVLAALRRLRSDGDLYRDMVANGLRRGEAFDPSVVTRHWIEYITSVAEPRYRRWRQSSWLVRQTYLARRYGEMRWRGVLGRLGLAR